MFLYYWMAIPQFLPILPVRHWRLVEGRESVPPQSKTQVCLQPWEIEIVSPAGATRGRAYGSSPVIPPIGCADIIGPSPCCPEETGSGNWCKNGDTLTMAIAVINKLYFVSDPGVPCLPLKPMKHGRQINSPKQYKSETLPSFCIYIINIIT